MNRRNFFKKTSLVGAGALLIPEIIQAAMPESYSENAAQGIQLMKNSVILFQGDSITDAGRKREDEEEPNKNSMLGGGYVLFTAANLLADNPEKKLKIFNRGISGNKVFQLQDRWVKDCLELKPDLVSILIGVNDFWHTKNDDYDGTLETYRADLNNLIARTKKELPGVKIVLCEPFIIAGGTALDNTWESTFTPYRFAAKQLAQINGAVFVPFQKVFNEALKKAPASYWGNDGVHPSMAGAQLMAQAWLKAVL